MKSIALAAGFAALLVTSALASPGCLELIRVYSWHVIDNKTLIVEDDLHEKFKVSLMGYCPALPYNETLGFKVIGGSQLSCISKGDEIISREHPLGAFHCPITNIVPYTPEMEKADKAAAAAKAARQGGNP